MKNSIYLVCFLFFCTVGGLKAQGYGAGVTLGYGLGVQGRYEHQITEKIVGAGAFTYFFNTGFNAWTIDLDGHYLLINENQLQVYPMAGLQFFNTGISGINASAIGLNVGGGAEYALNDLRLFGELKLGIGGFGLLLTGGILF